MASETPTRSSPRGEAHLDEAALAGLAIGDLAAEVHAAAIAHLERCARCRQAAALVQQGARDPDRPVDTEPALADLPPTEVRDALVGSQLGEYVVTEVVARGGMGAIYAAVQPVLARQVAIKLLLPEYAADPQLIDRLLAEGRMLAAIRHPNLVDIFGAGQTPAGQHYLVMDFLEGETLGSLLRRRGKLGAHHAFHILDGMLAGLDAAHRAGVLHRDLKPGNVFLVPLPDGTVHVKLLDFGLGKSLAAPGRTAPHLMLGTPGFMAPEQIRGDQVSARTDLYALGVTAFAMVSGQNPFPLKGNRELLLAHLDQPAPPLERLVPDLPRGLSELVAQLLEKDPQRRPASAQEVRRELSRLRRAAEAAPTERETELPAPLVELVRTRSFPKGTLPVEPAPTRDDRPVLPSPEAVEAPRHRGLWWAGAGALVALGFAAGLWVLGPAVTAREVHERLGEVRSRAAALDDTRRRAALAELEALEQRLLAGEAPAEVDRALEQARANHAL